MHLQLKQIFVTGALVILGALKYESVQVTVQLAVAGMPPELGVQATRVSPIEFYCLLISSCPFRVYLHKIIILATIHFFEK